MVKFKHGYCSCRVAGKHNTVRVNIQYISVAADPFYGIGTVFYSHVYAFPEHGCVFEQAVVISNELRVTQAQAVVYGYDCESTLHKRFCRLFYIEVIAGA